MSEEYRAKVFKSGNSVALRLPKALGLKEGTEVIVREARGEYSFRPADEAPRKIDLTGIAGTAPWLKPLTTEEREFDDPPRAWDLLDQSASKSSDRA
ncbi:AbrB/MazE/SpoVT family DNA-binding domain-containing protein [Rhizorhabdus sp.]|jgi:antitoxin VapB|uniref:AbrB/MazE/SpoVT family DNA-binding domain-containing protein n=1 Tax=Rhizorhabdus sp. TaxID=1968843 RepID=UPI001995FEDE|nr:AbrB/MazE/SpoVT family DNA-binding domain-containing protein [Rhizorhabdus sp.]MBD3762195.1 AbrB/MazE/SpoVT family DNA-binding domain-containing protein [Rhizorhabdus sp.]